MPHTTIFRPHQRQTVARGLTGVTSAAVYLAACLAASGSPLSAQRIRGLGDDATTIPAGTLRLDVRGEWSSADERYGPSTATAPNGTLRPLGDPFSLDTLGTVQLPALKAIEAGFRSLSGLPGVNVSFGRINVLRTDRLQITPIIAELGITRRWMVGLTVPIVKARSSVFVNTNPAGTEGNITLPNSSTRATVVLADTAYGNQMERAAVAVQTYCAGAGSGSPECTSNLSAVNAARTFGQQVSELYGTGTVLPVANSNIQQAIDARATVYRDVLNQFSTNVGSDVVPAITATAIVAPPPLTTEDLQGVLAEPSLGLLADTLGTVERVHLGDIELSAKMMVWGEAYDDTSAVQQGFRTRLAVGAAYRLPTGSKMDPSQLADIATGTHEAALGARGYLDVLSGKHFWASVVARYWKSLGSDVDMRVTDYPDQPYPLAARTATVHRTLGNLIELEAIPRWSINDFVSVSGQYEFRHQAASQYSGAVFSYAPDSATTDSVTVDPSSLSIGTGFSEHRAGLGLAFSNLHAYAHGDARIPFEVSYTHFQTVSGSGYVERQTNDQISFRLYYRLFGNGR